MYSIQILIVLFHSFLMLYFFQMQQQQQHHFEENFEDLTLGEETKMDIQEEIPLGISTAPTRHEQHRQQTLLGQIEDQDAYIRDLSLHADPDTISSEQEAQIAVSTIKKSFLTVSYLVADCDSAEQRNETANAFQHAAVRYYDAAQSCQDQLDDIDNRFHQIYKEFLDLTFKGMDIQQQLFSNRLAAWAMTHCNRIAKRNAPRGESVLDLPPSYLDFRIPEPPQEVIQEIAPYVQTPATVPTRGQPTYMAYCSHPHCDNAGVWYTPSKASSIPNQPLQKYCLSHKQPSHTAKEFTSPTKPTRKKRECPYDPEREERLALAYARDARQKQISDQRLHMRAAGQLLMHLPH